MPNFLDPAYLKTGNKRQQLAYHALVELGLFETLKAFEPILTGTIPINIDTPASDLDIICFWKDKTEFVSCLEANFGDLEGFQLRETTQGGEATILANFYSGGFEIEIFGQNIPTVQQRAYLHLLKESQILEKMGAGFRAEVLALKLSGIKTEPAFAMLLGLPNIDPYEELLRYEP